MGATIHELGHAFGLMHDSRVDANLIFTLSGYHDRMTNSFCAAEWLNVNRYFNLTQENFNEDTNVQMLTPILATLSPDIRLQFEVVDPDGLHQVQLFKPYGRYPSVIGYQSLSGNRATVEFATRGLVDDNNIVLRVIDKHGNFTSHSFHIEITALNSFVVLPDANLRLKIIEALGKPSDAKITVRDMLTLTTLNADNANINGIEGAAVRL